MCVMPHVEPAKRSLGGSVWRATPFLCCRQPPSPNLTENLLTPTLMMILDLGPEGDLGPIEPEDRDMSMDVLKFSLSC